jgi:hypothetical protein
MSQGKCIHILLYCGSCGAGSPGKENKSKLILMQYNVYLEMFIAPLPSLFYCGFSGLYFTYANK